MEETEHLVTNNTTLSVTEVDDCPNDIDLSVNEMQTNCKTDTELLPRLSGKQTELESKVNELTKKSEDLENENILLKKDIKRKEKFIRVLIHKLKTNLESTRLTVDAIERQLLNESSFQRNSDDIDNEVFN